MNGTHPMAAVAIPIPPDVEDRLRTVSRVERLGSPALADANRELLADTEGLLCSALFPVDRALMEAAPNLRVVSNFGVGFNNVDLDEATRRGIAVCNTPGVLTGAVADLTYALILASSRRLVENAAHARDGRWSAGSPPPALGFDLEGRTLGIVGLGRIGRAVARRAPVFGMRAIYHDLVREAAPEWSFCPYRSLDDLLRESDVVSLHVNLTPKSHRLIGGRELGLMRPSAWIVNTSRGAVVDQAALVHALQAGTIAGAALDVLEKEPPDADDPLLGLPNVIVLPHVGSATVETRAAMLDLAVENLMSVLSGRRPPECVNPEVLDRALRRRSPRA